MVPVEQLTMSTEARRADALRRLGQAAEKAGLTFAAPEGTDPATALEAAAGLAEKLAGKAADPKRAAK